MVVPTGSVKSPFVARGHGCPWLVAVADRVGGRRRRNPCVGAVVPEIVRMALAPVTV